MHSRRRGLKARYNKFRVPVITSRVPVFLPLFLRMLDHIEPQYRETETGFADQRLVFFFDVTMNTATPALRLITTTS